jgi:hypothetical protein
MEKEAPPINIPFNRDSINGQKNQSFLGENLDGN